MRRSEMKELEFVIVAGCGSGSGAPVDGDVDADESGQDESSDGEFCDEADSVFAISLNC